tara:strand:- start:250 stop:870 length:621 start_codon:yes stop_codon:yes gene_type:complete
MGFDLYGEKPIENEFEHQERWDELSSMSYEEREEKNLDDEYYTLMSKYEDINPGAYFRNNVWWWRPLWSFVCENCEDILTEKDMNNGCYNDAHIISRRKAEAIAVRLEEVIESEETKMWIKEHEDNLQQAKRNNKQVEAELKELKKLVEVETGNPDIYPAIYPDKFKKKYDEIYDRRDWASSYPFSKDNVINFIKFARQSGGFSIC